MNKMYIKTILEYMKNTLGIKKGSYVSIIFCEWDLQKITFLFSLSMSSTNEVCAGCIFLNLGTCKQA